MNLLGIKIKNYKSIKDMDLNFTSNTNKIEKDLLFGNFKLSESKKKGVPAFIAIMGRNAIGKTSILEALSFLSDSVIGGFSSIILNEMIKEKTQEVMKEINFTSSDKKGNDFMLEFNNKMLEIRKSVIDSVEKKEGKLFEEYTTNTKSMMSSFFSEKAGDINIPIIIKIVLDIPGKGEVELGILLEPDGNFVTTHDPIDNKYLITFSKNYFGVQRDYYMNDDKKHSPIGGSNSYYNTNNPGFEQCLIALEENIGNAKLVSLAQLADPLIDSIIFSNVKNGRTVFKNIILDTGSKIQVNELSDGTKKFLIIMETMFRAYSVNNSLVIMDELELSLHKELVNVIQWIMIEMFTRKNTQFLFTTHSPLILTDVASNKQVYIIEGDAGEQTVRKASTIMKSHENIIKYYRDGRISNYPDKEKARNSIDDFFEE